MISADAKQGVDSIFVRAAKAHLVMSPEDPVEISAVAGGAIVAHPEAQIVVLTVASYRFRLLTLFHLGSDRASVDYFSRSTTERAYSEVFCELANLCCGAMNRDLGKYFTHTGMSTPYLLEGRCLPFIIELEPGYVAQHRIAIGDAVVHASLCLCAYAPIDFRFRLDEVAEATGELELF